MRVLTRPTRRHRWLSLGILTVGFLLLGVPQVGSTSNTAQTRIPPRSDFESNPAPLWRTNGPCNFRWATDEARSPTHSLRIVSEAPGRTLCRWLSRVRALPVQHGESVHAEVWLRAQNVLPSHAFVTLTFWTAGGDYIRGSAESSQASVFGTTDWSPIDVSAPAPRDAAFARIEFRLKGAGTLWIDDLLVSTPGPPPLPVNISRPEIVGDPQVGSTLIGHPGKWIRSGGEGLIFNFAWLSCDLTGQNCRVRASGTSNTFTPIGTDIGRTIRLAVAARRPEQPFSANALSAPTAPVAPAP
jgi:hypothetical protein